MRQGTSHIGNRERGLFVDAISPPRSGIALPEEFVSAFRDLDIEYVEKSIPRSIKRAFAFLEEDEFAFFTDKTLSPDTVAFADSLRDPSRSSPLISREYVQADQAWASVAEAFTVVARCAAHATALTDILGSCRCVGGYRRPSLRNFSKEK